MDPLLSTLLRSIARVRDGATWLVDPISGLSQQCLGHLNQVRQSMSWTAANDHGQVTLDCIALWLPCHCGYPTAVVSPTAICSSPAAVLSVLVTGYCQCSMGLTKPVARPMWQ